ncbi:patatin-like phospholipase family protein [Gelidibacter sp. F63206]|uniref:patatin-like phospholipase family protein n=1 Tax=Gelidibacter sp. F63206 TaxID=2926425 RepID=UPI001FF578C7|nr:patatin-like phospholipase family protein [Gelidibacter sp. F63206]MCK0115044.1 patatin-like phospholipase family protein [Gelidibacter sp. F63206]
MVKILQSKINLNLFLLLFCIVFSQVVFAQEKKPKVALVLSGGGAKGIAHIRTLQVLDSLHIVPDLIVGNSMGSIVGGLYAMGYSGDSIASLTKNANWEKLLGGRVSLNKVGAEEKSEYNRYLIELDFKNGNINTGLYLLNDQNLREFIAFLAVPSYEIEQFDDLPIPFRAVATDIINGEEVILDQGSLAMAMRASMSIPGVFSPVRHQNMLLVDGGLLNNFPADIAKNLGADIIIGSDVGDDPKTIESLNSISALLFQGTMMNSNKKRPANRELCDILIDHSPYLTHTTSDFFKANAIYEEGKMATNQQNDALVALSNRLKKFKQRKHELPVTKTEFVFDTIVYQDISKSNLALVKARTAMRPNKKYTIQDIEDGLGRAMGTTIFKDIEFTRLRDDGQFGLILKGVEKSKHQIKGSLHFDGYRGAGLIANYTGRNIIGQASRSLITVDFAKQPKARVQYQKNFGSDRDWWWRTEVFGQLLEQKIFLEGKNVDEVKLNYFEFDNQINRNLSSLKSYVGFGAKHKYIQLKPTIDPEVKNNILSLEKYSFSTYEVYAHFKYSNLNDVLYPTKGSQIHAVLSRALSNNIQVSYIDPNIIKPDVPSNNYTKLSLGFEERVSLKPTLTGIISLNSGFLFEDPTQDDDFLFSTFGYGAKYFLGGNIIDPRSDNYTFSGLTESELAVSQFLKLGLGLQIKSVRNVFFIPHLEMASVGYGKFDDFISNVFSAKGRWENYEDPSFLASVGAMVSYKSILGPVNFDISWVNSTNKLRFFIGIGFPLNRSN